MTIYSAHDTTIFSLLAALGATRTAPLPKFAAHVVLELWQHRSEPHTHAPENNKFTVRIRYGTERLQGLPGCKDGECALAQFIEGAQGGLMPPNQCVPRDTEGTPDEEGGACCSLADAPLHGGR
jgi:hypothetical protein